MRHQRVMTFASSSCFHAISLHFLPSSMILLLLTNANYFVSGSGEFDTETSDYCQLCERHTGCIFPFDEPGLKCSDIENSDVNNDEIESIVHQHNVYRNIIARGRETRGNFGPQPAARNMMELTWDHELALLARRWAIQCNPVEKDSCRDVERFAVWQNVNTIKLDTTNDDDFEEHHNTSPSRRLIPRHVQSWFDEVENFDNARVGLVKFAMENDTSYLGIAGGMITHVGCGRATYRMHFEENANEMEEMLNPKATYHNDEIGTSDRVDVLICNYGPIDRTTPQILYEYYDVNTDQPCTNKGIVPSNEFDHLCVKSHKVRGFAREAMKNSDDEGSLDSENHNTHSSNRDEERSRSSAVSVALRKSIGARSNFQALAEFLSLVLLHIIAKTPRVHCC